MKWITLRIKYNQIYNYEQEYIGEGNVKTRHSPKQHKELFPHLKVLTITRNICNMQNKMSIIILMFSWFYYIFKKKDAHDCIWQHNKI